MIAVGHQPQYIPYIGIFNKIAKSDVFVFCDNLQFTKRTWQNRTLIKGNDGKEVLLSIPVITKNKNFQKISEVRIAGDHWKHKHLKSIELNYKNTEGFNSIFSVLEKHLVQKSSFLIDVTIPIMIDLILELGINTKIKYGSRLGIQGGKTDLLIDICKKTKCDEYISGEGAKDYFEQSIFGREGLTHKFNNFVHPTYYQGRAQFIPGMALLDLLCYEGIEKGKKIFWKNVHKTL